jgi:hypothetical protein
MEKRKVCSKCGSVFELTYGRTIIRDQDSINCEVCGEELHRWSEAKMWSAKLIERKENHLTQP